MQRINLNLDRLIFFCPVTGRQVLNEEDFDPSPAMLFCFFEDDANFQYALDYVKDKYNEGFALSNKKENRLSAFEELVEKKLIDPGYVLFSFLDRRSGNNMHIAFDMNYFEEKK